MPYGRSTKRSKPRKQTRASSTRPTGVFRTIQQGKGAALPGGALHEQRRSQRAKVRRTETRAVRSGRIAPQIRLPRTPQIAPRDRPKDYDKTVRRSTTRALRQQRSQGAAAGQNIEDVRRLADRDTRRALNQLAAAERRKQRRQDVQLGRLIFQPERWVGGRGVSKEYLETVGRDARLAGRNPAHAEPGVKGDGDVDITPAGVAKFTLRGGFPTLPFQVLQDIGIATAQDPSGTAKSSKRTAIESVTGIPQGLKMLKDDPKGAVKAMGEDYVHRYGPEVVGDSKTFRERVQTESGVTPFLLDAAAVTGGGGRLLGAAARRGAFGRGARELMTNERPSVRFSGGEGGVRPQKTSANLLVAARQRRLDTRRARRWRKLAESRGYEVTRDGRVKVGPGGIKRDARGHPMRLPALRPGAGEVLAGGVRESAPLRRLTGRVARDLGGVKGRGRVMLLTQRARMLPEIHKRIDKLSGPEQRALKYMVQLGLPGDDLPAAIRALQTRLTQIVEERARQGRENLAPVLDATNDEVPVLQEILSDPQAHLTPQVREAADELIAIQRQAEAVDPDLPPERAARRARMPQAALLGVERRGSARAETIVAHEQQLTQLERAVGTARRREARFAAVVGDRRRRDVAVSPRMQARLNEARVAVHEARAARDDAREHLESLRKMDADREPIDQFDQRIARAAEEAGLKKPGYWMSSPRPQANYSDAAIGTGLRAAGKSKRYEGKLFKIGAEEHSPDVFVRGVERNLKRRYSWALVARNMETHAFEWSRGQHGEGLTAAQILKQLDDNAIDARSVAFVNSRIVRKRDLDPDAAERGALDDNAGFPEADDDVLLEVNRELSDGSATLEQLQAEAAATVRDLAPEDVQGLAQNRYHVVPREVADELAAMTQPDGAALRAFEIVLKQKPARIILGTLNVPWLSFQVASNAMLTGLGGGVNPLDIFGAHKWFKGLPADVRDAVEVELGITHGSHFAIDQTRMGSTVNGRFANFYRGYKESKVGRVAHKMNPLDAMFRADELQNNFFRRVLFYNAAKKAAYKRMGANWRSIDGIQSKLMSIVSADPEKALQNIPARGRLFEEHAEHVNKFLGDYLTFSHKERQLLSRNVMFYGYLRFSLRFALYTLPVEHPIVTALMANVGRMGADEIKRLFGVPRGYQLPTNMLAQTYFGEGDDLRSINFGRMNPLLNAAVSAERASQYVGLVSPIYQLMADQAFNESSFTGKDFRINGVPTPAEAERPGNYYGSFWSVFAPGSPRNRIAVRDLLSLSFPYRVAEKTGIPGVVDPLEGPQSDDALLGSPRPIRYRDPEVVASIRDSTRRDQQRSFGSKLLGQLVPPVAPQPTIAPKIVEREREKEADVKNRSTGRKKKRAPKRSSGFGGFSAPSGGGNGGGWKWGG